jgi:uncharacterized protein YgbK (DUF1537 family)
MLLGAIADDFTGASDLANTLARSGFATAQFNGVPAGDAPAGCLAGVVSLKSRSIDAAEAIRQSLAALAWLRRQGCRQFIFKYCSTFDSTPAGNIGPVAEALAGALGTRGVVVCPAFPGAGRRVFQGHLFVHDRLLSESGMEKHPLTPMTDPDIRRWLRRQTTGEVGHVTLDALRAGDARRLLAEQGAAGRTLVVVDAISDYDLFAIGKAVAGEPLLTGGSGVAMGLAENFVAAGDMERAAPSPIAIDGPACVIAGSCSNTTRGQIEVHGKHHPTLKLDIEGIVAGRVSPTEIAARMWAKRNDVPLAYSSETPDAVHARQAEAGGVHLSECLDAFFGALATALVAIGFRRLVIAGGETSGAVVTALERPTLRIGPEIDRGVPALVAMGDPPLALALKSGNFGRPDFFARAAGLLGGEGQ